MIILESSPILDMRKSMRLSGGLPYEQQRHHFSNARRPLSPSRVLGFLSGLPKCVRMPIKYQDLVETLVLLNVRRVGQPRCSIQWFAGEETENPYGVHAVDPMSPRNIAILEERPLARPQHFSPRQQEGLSNQHLHRSHAHQLEDGLHSARTMPGLMEDKDSPDMTLSRSLTYPATRHQSKSTAADTDSDIVIVDAMEALVSPWAEEPAGKSRFLEQFEADPRLSALVPEMHYAKPSLWSKMARGRRSSKAHS